MTRWLKFSNPSETLPKPRYEIAREWPARQYDRKPDHDLGVDLAIREETKQAGRRGNGGGEGWLTVFNFQFEMNGSAAAIRKRRSGSDGWPLNRTRVVRKQRREFRICSTDASTGSLWTVQVRPSSRAASSTSPYSGSSRHSSAVPLRHRSCCRPAPPGLPWQASSQECRKGFARRTGPDEYPGHRERPVLALWTKWHSRSKSFPASKCSLG